MLVADSHVDITLCQHRKFPVALLLKYYSFIYFVPYYKRNTLHKQFYIVRNFTKFSKFGDAISRGGGIPRIL